MRFQVRKRNGQWEVWTFTEGVRHWMFSVAFATYWEAMYHVTGQFPYGQQTRWCPHLRPVIV